VIIGDNVDINRVKVSKTIRELAKIDYANLKEKTTLIDKTESQYIKSKINTIDEDFNIHTAGDIIRIEVKRGKYLFTRNFVSQNIDNRFDYTISQKGNKVTIFIEKETVNEHNFEDLMKLMYIHSVL